MNLSPGCFYIKCSKDLFSTLTSEQSIFSEPVILVKCKIVTILREGNCESSHYPLGENLLMFLHMSSF